MENKLLSDDYLKGWADGKRETNDINKKKIKRLKERFLRDLGVWDGKFIKRRIDEILGEFEDE